MNSPAKPFVFKYVLLLLAMIFLLHACSKLPKEESTKAFSDDQQINHTGKTLTIGSVGFSFKNEEMVTQPLGNFLLNWLKDYNYTNAEVIIVKTKEEIAQLANENKIDLYFASLFPTIYVDKKSIMKPELRIWQNNIDTYKTIFFTKKESSINSLKDFTGKVVTMEREYSTSGYFLPSIILEKNGHKLRYVEAPNANINNTDVGYCFSNDDENTVFWVLSGKSEIGVCDNISLEMFAGNKINELKIIYESYPLPRNIVSIRNNLPNEVKHALFKAFEEFLDSEEGKNICKTFYNCTKFDSLNFPEYNELADQFSKYIM